MNPPTDYVKVTNVAGSTEYFHPDTGMRSGDFYDDNDGDWIESQIDGFLDMVYGGISNITRMYYLWGEWDPEHNTHQGHDMRNPTTNSGLYSAHDGTITVVGAQGRIGIYDKSEGVTYFYAHMTDRRFEAGEEIFVGDYLGRQGADGADVAHLHFEVRNGRITTMGLQNNKLNTLNPYDYM